MMASGLRERELRAEFFVVLDGFRLGDGKIQLQRGLV